VANYYATIQGVGTVAFGVASRYRWTQRSTIADELDITGMTVTEQLASEVDPLTGEVTNASFAFQVPLADARTAELLRSHVSSVGALTADVSGLASDTSIDVDDDTKFSVDDLIRISAECMRVTAKPGGDVLTVQRGVLGTIVQAHDYLLDGEIYTQNQILRGRWCVLYQYPSTVLAAGVVNSIRTVKTLGAVEVRCTSAEKWLDKTIGGQAWRGMTPPASWNLPRFVAQRPADSDRVPVLEDMGINASSNGDPWLVLESEADDVLVKCTRDGASVAQATDLDDMMIRGTLEDVSPLAPYDEVLYSGDDDYSPFRKWDISGSALGDPTRHPIDVFLMLVLSGFDKQNYPTGATYSYDVLPRSWGLRIPSDLVDVDEWENVRDVVTPGLTASQIVIRPGNAGEQLRKLLRPVGLGWTWSAAGALKPVVFSDVSASPTAVTQADLVEPYTEADRQLAKTLERIDVTWSTGEESTVYNAVERFWYPEGGGEDVSIDASFFDLADYHGEASAVYAALVSLIERYQFAPPMIRLHVVPGISIDAGDHITLTHALVPGPDGSRGLTAAPLFVASSRYDLETQTREIEAVYLAHDIDNAQPIAWSAKVTSYDSATSVITVEQAEYETTGEDDTDGLEVGDDIILRHPSGEAKSDALFGLNTTAKTSTTITHAGSWTTANPSPDDLVLPVRTGGADNGEDERHIFLAEADGDIQAIAGGYEAGYQYTS